MSRRNSRQEKSRRREERERVARAFVESGGGSASGVEVTMVTAENRRAVAEMFAAASVGMSVEDVRRYSAMSPAELEEEHRRWHASED